MSDLKLEEFYNWCDERIAIAKAASPGPWEVLDSIKALGTIAVSHKDPMAIPFARMMRDAEADRRLANATHIAASDPQTQIALLTALREAVTALEFYADKNMWNDEGACVFGVPCNSTHEPIEYDLEYDSGSTATEALAAISMSLGEAK